MKKEVYIDPRAEKEFDTLPEDVQLAFTALFRILKKDGELREPDAKKISGIQNLYELRVRLFGQWRGMYCYTIEDAIVMLHFFHKKTQKTSRVDLNVSTKRLKDYK